MIGRLRLMRMIFEGDDSNGNFLQAKEALIQAGSFIHTMQPQAKHDLGYLLWFDNRKSSLRHEEQIGNASDSNDIEEKAKMEAKQIARWAW